MKSNPEQEIAIKNIDKNLSLIAGAGTGKTKVLTERFVHILENGDLPKGREVESIVAITFTKKASGEMIERIRREIRNKFPQDGEWRRYYRDIEKANISTIHSFCMNILKENSIRAGLDPIFEVIEEYEAGKMLKDSILEVLDLELEEDRDLYELFKKINIDRSHRLIEDMESIYNEIRSMGLDMKEVGELSLKRLEGIQPLDDKWIGKARSLTNYLIEKGSKSSKISKVLGDEECKLFLEGGEAEDLARLISLIKTNIGANKKEQETIDQLEILTGDILISLEVENIPYYKSLLRVLEKVDRLYTRKKDSFGGLDYEDLQIKTRDLLEDEGIRSKYQRKYSYIMIDEFQDTNMLQKQIFYRICSIDKDLDRNNLFIVGDPKQSIYGFRGADLDVFYQVVEDIEASKDGLTLSMDKNYRTVDTVLGFVNTIFSELMGGGYGALRAHKESKRDLDIEIIENENLEIPEDMTPGLYGKHYEGEQIAKRIIELVDSGDYSYKDFAMLFRARTRNHIYENALRKYGVPFYNIGSQGFFQEQEVLDIINALKSIDNREDHLATIGFLRSNFIGLNDNSIYDLFKNKEEDIHLRIKKLIDEDLGDGEEKAKLKLARDFYQRFTLEKDIYGVSEIIEKLIDSTDFKQTNLLKENGRQIFANISKFEDLARAYEIDHRGNLSDFLEYIEEIRGRNESQGEIEGENTDAVKILTIHKSKGLEFPVVILPEMSSRGVYDSNKMFFDSEEGLAINIKDSNQAYDNIKTRRREKTDGEMKRVLYVAMTRAEKMLIIGNQGNNSGFKKMIGSVLGQTQYREIEEITLEPNRAEPVKLIEEELIRAEYRGGDMDKHFPLINIDRAYNKGFKKRISVSQYMVFKECRRKYFLENRINISQLESHIEASKEEKDRYEDHDDPQALERSEELLDPALKGTIIHEICELYRDDTDKRELAKRVFHKKGLVYSDELYSSIEGYIDNYIDYYQEDLDQIHYEKPFFLQLNGAYISGYIDELTIDKGQISIVDLKTNRLINKKKLVENYRPQLQLYAYVAAKILKLPIKNASILFLENGEMVDIGISKEELEDNIGEIESFVDFTRKNHSIDGYEKSETCNKFCKYINLCNLKEEMEWENI